MTAGALATLAQMVSVGDHVVVRLADRDIEGAIVEISAEAVLLEFDDGVEYVAAAAVVGFRLQRLTASEPVAAAPVSSDAPEPEGDDLVEAGTSSRRSNIELVALFERQHGVAPSFAVAEPSFEVAAVQGDEDTTALVRAKNRYNYALKVHEPGRVLQDVDPLALIGEQRHVPSLITLAARLADLGGDRPRAKRLYAKAFGLGDRTALAGLASSMLADGRSQQVAALLVDVLVGAQAPANDGDFTDLLMQTRRVMAQCPDRQVVDLARVLAAGIDEMAAERGLQVDALVRSLDAVAPEDPDTADQAPSDVLDPGASDEAEQAAPVTDADPATAAEVERLATAIAGRLVGEVTRIFQSQSGGLLRSRDSGALYLFQTYDITDERLREAITSGVTGHEVEFSATRPPRDQRSYPLASDITAISVRSAARPPEPRAPVRYQGETHFHQAKRAEYARDLDSARALYEQEIAESGPKQLSAIKDLAWLMNRLHEPEGALALLDRHADLFARNDKRSVDNIRLTVQVKAGMYEDALLTIRRLRIGADGRQSNALDRQQALCLAALGDVEEAKRVLRSSPAQDQTLLARLDTLTTAPGGSSQQAAQLEQLATYGLGLTALAEFCLDNADLFGVDERSKARGFFDKHDFRNVDSQLGRIGGRRPRERASLALTLAAICYREPHAAGDRQLSTLLRRYFSLMAEAGLLGNEPPDSVRTYSAESLSLGASEERVREELAVLLATYSPASEPTDASGGRLPELIAEIFARDEARATLLSDLPYYCAKAPQPISVLVSVARDEVDDDVCRQLQDAINDVERETDRLRAEQAELEPLRQSIGLGADRLEAASQVLDEVADTTRFALDRSRLRSLAQAAKDASRYWVETDFQERSASHTRAMGRLEQLQDEIESAPTSLSVEHLRPLVEVLTESLEQSWATFIAEARPELELGNVLSEDRHTLDSDGSVIIALSISSTAGSAPVERVELVVADDDGLQVAKAPTLPGVLRGGDQREVQLVALPTTNQIAEQAFTMRCRLRYQTSDGEPETSKEFLIPVSLDDRPFTPITPNPYEAYSGGTIVDDPHMFFGRRELVGRIIRQVTDGPIGQCFVLYGQKRSGKSSVLSQVEQQLELPFLPVKVTLGILDTSNAQGSFVSACAREMQDRMQRDIGSLPDGWPSYDDVRAEPIRAMAAALRLFGEAFGIGDEGRVVLLVDEFTYIYEYIEEGIADPAFMRQWKAMLELGLFSAVVAGQDSMPRFKQAYANEFGVTHDERVSYLPDADARALATTPISFEGSSRYRGRSLDRMLRLTAGSPFYLQILCDEIVNVLNSRHVNFVTEADVDEATSNLISGVSMLPIERFDPLISAAGESVALASKETYLNLLSAIAQHSAPGAGARVQQLDVPQGLEQLLDDMIDREVLRRERANRVRISVGLFEEWLRVNRPLGDDL